ncbi:MAG: DUF2065 family protein [Candidatus Omnitrophica bacterium]|nr:DUF2065 family protein [Candidatus Omnitrophota bacterium]
MIILIKLVGIVITVFGLAIFASPEFSQKVFDFFKEGKRIYYAGVVRVAAGALILLSASQSAVPLAAIALGVMFLVSGIVVFVSDLEKMKAFILTYSQMPSLVIRLFGLVGASFGILIFSIF